MRIHSPVVKLNFFKMARRKGGLQDDGIRDLLEDLEVEDLGEDDDLGPLDWDWGDEDDDEMGVKVTEVTFSNNVEVARHPVPGTGTSPANRYLYPVLY